MCAVEFLGFLIGVLYKENFGTAERGRIWQSENQLYRKKNSKNSTAHILSQKQKKGFLSKTIQPYKTKQKQKAEVFSSYFSFKIVFKPNKGQESQVPSQDHHD